QDRARFVERVETVGGRRRTSRRLRPSELVRGRMDVGAETSAVDRLEASRSRDGDVLAELAGELGPLLVEPTDGLDPLRLDEVEHLLAKRLELLVVRHRLGLAADRDHRSAG